MDDQYKQRTYGDIDVDFGNKLGIVVVDFQVGFTDSRYALGGAELIMRAVENTSTLLSRARAKAVPVAVCYTAYRDEIDMPYWKISAVRETFRHDHPSIQLDTRIYDPAYDLKVCKTGPSIFFNTPVVPYFAKARVDTVIVTGCTTSGCIRASVIDSFSYRFRTIVPEDCVGDHEHQPHKDNLRDIGRRYADIVDLATCMEKIEAHNA